MQIIIIGNGAWGTALSIHFSKTHETALITRTSEEARQLNQHRENKKYLPGYLFCKTLKIQSIENVHTVPFVDLAIIATPVADIRQTLKDIPMLQDTPILVGSKGFEQGTGLLPHQIISNVHPSNTRIGLLSGPVFAQELAAALPTAICLATDNTIWGKEASQMLNSTTLRIYSNNDPIGVGVGGAIKNIIAIASGFSDGKKAGNSARSALITRGLAETTRLALVLGAKEETMRGLGSLGDLILTCTGNLSRNRQVGLQLAQGKMLHDILKELGHIAEGINTLQEVLNIARIHNIDMPITQMLSALLSGAISADHVINAIMLRLPTTETA